MNKSTWQHTISWIQFFCCGSFIIFDIYAVYNYIYINRDKTYIKVRIPTLTYIYILAGVLMIAGRMFLEPHNCPFTYCKLKDDNTYTQQDTVQSLNSIVFAVRTTFLGFGYLLKLWYLYYSLKLQTLFLNNKWWMKINKNLNKNWWIKNINKYGKPTKKTWIILFIIMSAAIIFAIVSAFAINHEISKIVAYINFMAMCLFTVIFYCKIPKMNDIYGIKTEMKIATATLTAAFLWYGTTEFATS